MPLYNYDYDYSEEYEVERKHNNDALQRKRDKAYRRTSTKTKEQVRQFMLETSDYYSTRRKNMSNPELAYESSIPYVRRVYDFENAESSNRLFNFDMATRTRFKESYSKEVEEVELEDVEEEEELPKTEKSGALKSFKRFVLFFAGACIALFICYRYSIINEKFNSVERAKRELLNAQTVNEQLQADIDSETDISYVENFAKYQLGMQKPQDSQIVYVNVEKQDKVYTPVKHAEDEDEQTWFDKLIEKIANTF